MENQVVRRRTSLVAAHVAASHEEMSAYATHLFPMSCSNSLNPIIRRCDNRMSFARQGSNSQGCFMRQHFSNEQVNCMQPANPAKAPPKYTRCGAIARDDPMFAKSRKVEQGFASVRESQSSVQSCGFAAYPAPDGPRFARPNQSFTENKQVPAPIGSDLTPRMNVEESRFSFIVTLEIPGVSSDDIKVEIHNQSLVVTGNRSTLTPRSQSSSYHKKEISRGPFHIVWPLPANANKATVSAEIQVGLLTITIPKLSGIRWLRKAHL